MISKKKVSFNSDMLDSFDILINEFKNKLTEDPDFSDETIYKNLELILGDFHIHFKNLFEISKYINGFLLGKPINWKIDNHKYDVRNELYDDYKIIFNEFLKKLNDLNIPSELKNFIKIAYEFLFINIQIRINKNIQI